MPDLPSAIRVHLDAISDGVGILQHAIGRTGDPAHGYCSDDVARALELDLMHARQLGWAAVSARARSNLQFLADAYVSGERSFRNFRSVEGVWRDQAGSEDCQGRVTLALGSVLVYCRDKEMVAPARALLLEILPGIDRLNSPRAIASTILGLEAALDAGLGEVREAHARLAHRLLAAFDATAPGWYWPETVLTYENGLLPRALISAGRRLGLPTMTVVGLRSLDWLLEIQTAPAGHLSPVGNGWWPRGGPRSEFDQQPIEATALLRACGAALAATGDRKYAGAMEQAFEWFLGANDLGLPLVDPARGAGCDGLTAFGVNVNEGAESTLMWLIAVEQIRLLQGAPTKRAAKPTAPAAFLA
ncbi:MAG: hypothetical protein ABI744_04835 [Chloroflexota bacterium]